MTNLKMFSDDEKEKIRKIAIALEYELDAESKNNIGISEFSEKTQIDSIINRAKAKDIAYPSPLLNLAPWLFWSPLAEWFATSDSKACLLLFKFSAAIKGLPYEETGDA